VLQVMDDLRIAKVDFLTIGQYLRPTPMQHPVISFVTPAEFKAYETIAYSKGFLMVSASPLTRSSYHAGENFRRIRAATVDVATFARSAGISNGCRERHDVPKAGVRRQRHVHLYRSSPHWKDVDHRARRGL